MGADHTRAALEFVHGLLQRAAHPPTAAELLRELGGAFGAWAAGLAASEGTPVVRLRQGQGDAPGRWPWEEQPGLLERVRHSPVGVAARTADGRTWLLAAVWTPAGADWLLWLEAEGERDWTPGESAALPLAGQALARLAGSAEGDRPDWARALERAQLQDRLEASARVTGKLAHDFGNVLTGILGFAELSLNQLPPDSLPHHYVREVWQAAQQGAQWIQKLQMFSRRRAAPTPPASLSSVVALEEARVRAAWGANVALHISLPEELPPLAVEGEALRQALAQLLDNAREAVSGRGVVTVSARVVELGEADCHDLLGGAVPGPHVEVTVTDTGAGLSTEARQRLLRELFYSTKVRRRGLGLAVVYGILQSYRGGLRFGPHPEQGTAVRLFLPAAAVPQAAGPASQGAMVLIVDDDPLVLRFMSAVLEGEGMRARAVAGGAEAFAAYVSASEPFALVLADIQMPQMNGYELARRLRRHDPGVNVLFISSEAGSPRGPHEEEATRFPLLPKPFRADGLVQAVRAALARGRRGGEPSKNHLGTN
jgi:signal transduction histidine kinase/CheY-like chemotaxis protein